MSQLSSRVSLPESRLIALNPPPVAFSCTPGADSGDSTRLVLDGELDLATHGDLKRALDEAQAHSGRVVLDLSGLTLIDCAGLFVLFAAAERSRGAGAVLILRNPRGQVRRMLELVGSPHGAVVLDNTDEAESSERRAAA